MTEVFRFAVQRPVQRAAPKDVGWKSIRSYRSPQRAELHARLYDVYSDSGSRADMRATVENYAGAGKLVAGLASVRLKGAENPESLGDLDGWLLDRDNRAAPGEVLAQTKALFGKEPRDLVKADNALYQNGRNALTDGLLGLTVHSMGREALREEVLRGLRLIGLLERLAAKGQAEEPKDAEGVRRYLLSALVLLPSDVFPLPVEEGAQMPPSPPEPNLAAPAANRGASELEAVLGAASELRAALRPDGGREGAPFAGATGEDGDPDGGSDGDPSSGSFGESGRTSWGISQEARSGLSEATRAVVREVAGPRGFDDVPGAVALLEAEASRLSSEILGKEAGRTAIVPLGGAFVDLSPFSSANGKLDGRPERVPADALVRAPGVIDLKVVRQKLKRYELGEVAHVENVLKGESNERTHRRKATTETTVLEETERTEELEQDLQSTERFELQTEASSQAHEDAHLEGGVQARASYGPTLEVSANAGFALNSSKDEASRQAQTYARDVTQRSAVRIQERVREQRTVRTLNEVEETNKHAVDNSKGTEHVVGVYRFVDKVYEAQMFDYGKRMLLEFNVPEPAAFFLHALKNRAPEGIVAERPNPPIVTRDPDTGAPLLEPRELSPDDLRTHNYLAYVRQYAVSGATPPPKEYEVVATSIVEGPTFRGEANPKEIERKTVFKTVDTLKTPAGYKAIRYHLISMADSGDRKKMLLAWNVGDTANHHAGTPSLPAPWGFGVLHDLGGGLGAGGLEGSAQVEGTVPVALYYQDVWGLAVTIEVLCQRTMEMLREWQLKTYEQIMRAYFELKGRYDEEVAAAAARQGVGARGLNPQRNREIEREELKKATISMMRGGRFEEFDAVYEDTEAPKYPEIDVAEAQGEGSLIQFFEQAFEWPQMTYLFYPYFWGRKGLWADRSRLDDPADPLFSSFLRAGAARVAVPVRRGFEDHVNAYLATDQVWGGGDLPAVGTPLHVSVAQEIRELQVAPADARPDGNPWEVTLPTQLVYLQKDAKLPGMVTVDDPGGGRPNDGPGR